MLAYGFLFWLIQIFHHATIKILSIVSPIEGHLFIYLFIYFFEGHLRCFSHSCYFQKFPNDSLWNAGMVSVPLGHWLSLGFHLSQLESLITPMLGPYPRVPGAFCMGLWSGHAGPSGPSTWGGVNHGGSGDLGEKVKQISDAAMQLPTHLFMNENGPSAKWTRPCLNQAVCEHPTPACFNPQTSLSTGCLWL